MKFLDIFYKQKYHLQFKAHYFILPLSTHIYSVV